MCVMGRSGRGGVVVLCLKLCDTLAELGSLMFDGYGMVGEFIVCGYGCLWLLKLICERVYGMCECVDCGTNCGQEMQP